MLEEHLKGVVEKELFVDGGGGSGGRRMDVRRIVEEQVSGAVGKRGVVVLSCGPEGMADEVRGAIYEVGRRCGGDVRLVEESFSW